MQRSDDQHSNTTMYRYQSTLKSWEERCSMQSMVEGQENLRRREVQRESDQDEYTVIGTSSHYPNHGRHDESED